MPSWDRDPDASAPNRPWKAGGCFVSEFDDGVLIDRRGDDGKLAFTGGTFDDDEPVTDGTPVFA
jgi:hypothetical protein